MSSSLCRSCGGADLEPILSLGRMPLANALLTEEGLRRPEPVYPMDLAFCAGCSLVQLRESVPPDSLFREYLYFSSYSDTLLEHAREIAHRLIEERALTQRSLVVELASNDGYLLQYFRERGIPVLGIEPALNVAKVAQEKGIPTVTEFFGEKLARELVQQGKRADVIIGNNVLAHVPDLNGFVHGIRLLLKDEGMALIEVPYVKDMIDHCEFDTIYHEHLSYYSLTSLVPLFRRQGLALEEAEHISIHGGSLRLRAVPAEALRDGLRVTRLLAEEASWGADRREYYRAFASRVENLKQSLRTLLGQLKSRGKRIAAYGAAAKGTVLLNYCGIGTD
ncbi:MAG: methyltransferase domain-containing protein, partial [Gammaproteobacteria bacterium]